MPVKNFVELEHTADIKFKITGKTPSEIFSNVAMAFSSYLTSGKKIKATEKMKIEIAADNIGMLMYKFIDELIYLLDAEHFAVSSAKISFDQTNNQISAILSGFDSRRCHLNHVKAATYAEMYIKKINKTWEAQIVLDV